MSDDYTLKWTKNKDGKSYEGVTKNQAYKFSIAFRRDRYALYVRLTCIGNFKLLASAKTVARLIANG
jgi:hypothetical protein